PVGPFRQGADRLAHRALRALLHGVRERGHRREVVFVHEGDEPVGAHLVAGHLGLDVAEHHLAQPHVGPDHRREVLVQRAAAVELERRDLQALLVDLAGAHRVAGAADVGAVRDRPHEPHERAPPEHGAERRPPDRDPALLRDVDQAAPHDPERHRVEGRAHAWLTATTRLWCASTSNASPGPTTVVASRSSTMAGPVSRAPGRSRYRSYTGTSANPSVSGKYAGRRPRSACTAQAPRSTAAAARRTPGLGPVTSTRQFSTW